MRGTAVVIGAGIGGLAAAHALHRVGWSVTLVERLPTRNVGGAGWSFAPNALAAMDALGLGDAVRAISAPSEAGTASRRADGTTLMSFNPATDTELLANRRRDLYALLDQSLPSAVHRVTGDATVTDPGSDASPATIAIDGASRIVDLVVAADGIGSHTRRSHFNAASERRFQNVTGWIGLTPERSFPDVRGFQLWERGIRMGVHPVGKGRQYWFLLEHADAPVTDAQEKSTALERVTGWAGPAVELIASTEASELARLNVEDIDPIAHYVKGRVALLGDAAHAMTPMLAQGAAQSLEDAVTLAWVLWLGTDVPSALASYEVERKPRSQLIQRLARTNAKFTLSRSALIWAISLATVRLIPPSVVAKQTRAYGAGRRPRSAHRVCVDDRDSRVVNVLPRAKGHARGRCEQRRRNSNARRVRRLGSGPFSKAAMGVSGTA